MFLPSTHSFQLVRRPNIKFVSHVFFPYTDSFVLTRRYSTKFDSSFVSENSTMAGLHPVTQEEQVVVEDHKRRAFLKVATIAGVGVIASQLSPKKAHALIMGSSPTTGVVGVKDSTNTRINPATEETAATLLKTSDLTFDGGALEVKVTSVSGAGSSSFSDSSNVAKSALVDADRHVQVDVLSSVLPSSASTETTLQTISFGGFKFVIRMATVGDVDYVGEASIGTATSAASWRVKKIDSTTGVIIQWAGTGVFDQVWDNRASLSYS